MSPDRATFTDPDELRNVAGDPAYATVRLRLAATLAETVSGASSGE